MLIALIQLTLGVVILFFGGGYLVQGATRVALLSRLSTTVIGLTVVAMGTSLPELAVSMGAAARGVPDLAYGNIVGSNVFNVGAILAITALIGPVVANLQTVKMQYPFMLGAAVVVVLLSLNGKIGRLEGGAFLATLILFIAYVVYASRREMAEDEALALDREVQRAAHVQESAGRAWGVNLLLIGIGIVGLVGGAELVVRGAVKVALAVGVDGRVVGLTVVAMGTSLPELATSVVAARRRELEIALANIIGSNIFNLLAILGATAAIFPVPIHPRAIGVDNWVMLAFCAAILPSLYIERRVSRRDAAILLTGFVLYIGYVVVTRAS
jgi:cation:H+ antiporter